MNILDELFTAIVDGNMDVAIDITKLAIDNNYDPKFIIENYMIKGMEEIGTRFQNGKAFVPELLMAARAMKASMELLTPLLVNENDITLGKIMIGTVKGDLHDIGKNLVASMFEGCGFKVINLGVDVDSKTFIQKFKEEKPDIIGMSALLTTTMSYMQEVIEEFVKEGLRDKVKFMIGGAPVSEGFAIKIGADAYSNDANSAVVIAKQLLNIH